jgi:hypothetical protein
MPEARNAAAVWDTSRVPACHPARRPRTRLAAALALVLAASALTARANPLVTDNPAAGPGAVTLLVYDGLAQPFSLMDVRAVLARLLTRANTRVVTKSVEEVRPDDLRSASYLVWLGTGRTPSPARLGWTSVDKPVLVCGMPPLEAGAWAGVNGLRKFPPKAESYPSARITLGRAVIPTPVSYAIAAKAEGDDSRTFAEIATPSGPQTLAWQTGNVFWFPALPLEQGVGVALSGILPYFYGFTPSDSGVLLTLDDFHLGCDASALKRASDYLAQANIPFAVSVRVPGADEDAARVHEFVGAVRYAQARRGRIFVLPAPGDGFWNLEFDRPPTAEAIEAAGQGVAADVGRCLENGVLPFGIRLPDSGVGIEAAARMARMFDFGIGAVLPSEATATATFIPATVTRVAGRLLLAPPGPSAAAREDYERNLLLVPGAVVSVSVPAWQTFEQMRPELDRVMALGAGFLDAAEAAVTISTPVGAFWNARAGATKPDFAGRAILRTYDAAAQQLSEKEISADSAAVVESPPDAQFFSLTPCTP